MKPFCRSVVVFALLVIVRVSSRAADAPTSVQLRWLDGAPPSVGEGVTWGVPWPKGVVQANTPMRLATADGRRIEVQTWPLSYWADGSVKWSAHAVVADANLRGALTLTPGGPAERSPVNEIKYAEDDTGFTVDTGAVRARIPKSGANLVESLFVGGRKVAQDGRLMLVREDRADFANAGVLRQEQFTSRVQKVTLEQSGPVRATVKIEGVHHAMVGEREWLPFTVRLYFYASSPAMRITHTVIFDGDGEKDFIKGLGLQFSVPFAEELHNRHMRFAGDGSGVWVQPVRLLPGYRPSAGSQITDSYADHLAGKRMPNLAAMEERARSAAESVATYNDARLTQLGPDGFSIDKRTSPENSWLHVTNGRRALGLAVLGDVSGGIAIGQKNFWEKYPASLEISGAAGDVGTLKVWFWSPEAAAMDLRHYDDEPHGLTINYEDWKPGWSTPLGLANTSELTLWAFAAIPSNADLVSMAKAASAPPMLVCTPEYYHEQKAFGFWSLPDRSSPAAAWVEDQVTGLVDFYRTQVDERAWYGFWDFGDVMHNFDFGRHEWRYDVGGWAWVNTELMPDMLLWYSFLRTGRADIFRMAENMTRHTSEVDVYHIGPFAPLGSRHNVNHWGDGAKQPRISHAGLKRFYYFLTADERVGDLLHEQLDADFTYAYLAQFNGSHYVPTGDGGARLDARASGPAPRPEAFGPRPTERTVQTSLGLEWLCYSINWGTEWERTRNTVWGDRVLADMKSMAANTQDGRFRGRYFDMIFGGPENMFQLESMFDVPEFWTAWANTCESIGRQTAGNEMTGPRMLAYAAHAKKSKELGLLAWDKLIGNALATGVPPVQLSRPIESADIVKPVHDPVFLGASAGWQLHGPASVQWALNAIETLDLAHEWLPEWEAAHVKK